MNSHFMKNVTITSSTDLQILVRLFLVLIIDKRRISKMQKLNVFKKQYQTLTGQGRFIIRNQGSNGKLQQKR